jgi:hypothetical protein
MEMFWQVLSLARDKDLSAMAIDAELEIALIQEK